MPLLMSEASLSEADLTRFGQLLASPDYYNTHVKVFREEDARQVPPQSTAAVRARLGLQNIERPSAAAMPGWAKHAGTHRDCMRGVAFRLDKDDHTVDHWKFIYAVQNPTYVRLENSRNTSSIGF
eukprot:NODE_4428_length_1893_cov_5.343715.p3 GENE.NODE_4428_length_1893_cov_5.343715~~NODE_4428_length_1893_cov_5.343715.p3  ORF type:complete len:125 (-),score=32.15 NODE_4428_length_1893_cov_5.343715:1134-1508(-)